jgi:BirA family transcriptional regulator, biotin operon repressor / biotin---[acetyl-CoA-carboxylase] ligase
MTTAADLERALAAAGLRAPVRWDEVTGSTNRTAAELAAAGAPEWTLVAAGHQTEGRGRQGRPWTDIAGGALMFSLVLRPKVPPDRLGLVSLLAGAAMAEACEHVASAGVRCKWPNDLILGGRKLGGILAESAVAGERVEHVVVGIGVNLHGPAPVSGAAVLGADVDATSLLGSFLQGFHGAYGAAGEELAVTAVARWRAVASTLGRNVEVVTAVGRSVRGEAVDVDERGGLVVMTDGGRQTVAFGDARHLA